MARVINDTCISCGSCAAQCPVEAISQGDTQYVIDADSCIDCGACGAPTCRAFAEDVVKKMLCPDDCPIKNCDRS